MQSNENCAGGEDWCDFGLADYLRSFSVVGKSID